MNLDEYQAKGLFAARGIPVPDGRVAASPMEAREIAQELGGRVAVKAQVQVGGRGKAGGIVLADTPDDALREASRLLGSSLKGALVRRVLVERAAHIARELYVGLIADRAARRMALLVSAEGGVEIEEAARAQPERVRTLHLDPFLGLRSYHLVQAAGVLDLPKELWSPFQAIGQALYHVAAETEATLAEINPLVITDEGQLLALDAKMTLDDSALFRHPDLIAMRDTAGELPADELPAERQAREAGISYVPMDGDIGCMVNGAGLAMAAMDVVKLYGGEPANFLDIGGGARAERVSIALEIILSDPKVKAVLVNIFGGITRCDEVARGIVAALEELQPRMPIVVRLVGTNEAEGRAILEQAHLPTAASLAEAARLAVAAARAGGGAA
ncbi:MAG: ADP-forming succinate--CoA ligase subunit beta [Chloroflexi bacterium]|jgi:succinyl-CoA synthetase beta subunit|nr:ADP-forming succinate--CoA ligase subunit beta [Chloroflexota bacterium]